MYLYADLVLPIKGSFPGALDPVLSPHALVQRGRGETLYRGSNHHRQLASEFRHPEISRYHADMTPRRNNSLLVYFGSTPKYLRL